VASAKELNLLMKKHAAKLGVKATRAKFASLHEGKVDRVLSSPAAYATGVVAGFSAIQKESEEVVTKEHVASALETKTLAGAYESLLPKYGKVATSKAVKQFLDNLKVAQERVDISRVDCSYLKGKLASTNGIIGSSKCSGCSYRNCMHCGLTGGTLISFPGMVMPNSKKRASNTQDGNQVLSEFELDSSISQQELDTEGYSSEEVESSGPMNLE
jgi:hypothetical protein